MFESPIKLGGFPDPGTAAPAATGGLKRSLVYHLDFTIQETQNLKTNPTPVIDGIQWRSQEMGQARSFQIVNGQGLVAVPEPGTTANMRATSQYSPRIHTLLGPADSGSLGLNHPLARMTNAKNACVHYVAIFDDIPETANTATHGGYFGIVQNESASNSDVPTTSDSNCFQARIGRFNAADYGAAGLQSGVGHNFKSGTDYVCGRGAANTPLAANMTELVQLISVDQNSWKIQSAPISAAPGSSGFPDWDAFQVLNTQVLWFGLSPGRAYYPHLFFGLATGVYNLLQPAFVCKHLYVYADTVQ